MESAADVVVIGGGVIGLATALELAEAGLKICVVDQAPLGRAASWAAGGILAALPPDQITPGLAPLLHSSIACYATYCSRLHEGTGINPEYLVSGLTYFSGEGTQYFPSVAQVRNPRLLKALICRLNQLGVQLRPQTRIDSLDVTDHRLVGVASGPEKIPCAMAVVAAGAWSGAMTGLPIKPIKGEMLLLQAQPYFLKTILLDEQVYAIPRSDGKILIGSTLEDAGFDLQPTGKARQTLLDACSRLMPELAGFEVIGHWAGLRPQSSSGLPLIGADSQVKGLFYNTGHFRLGITLAPASARLLMQIMLVQKTLINPELFQCSWSYAEARG